MLGKSPRGVALKTWAAVKGPTLNLHIACAMLWGTLSSAHWALLVLGELPLLTFIFIILNYVHVSVSEYVHVSICGMWM